MQIFKITKIIHEKVIYEIIYEPMDLYELFFLTKVQNIIKIKNLSESKHPFCIISFQKACTAYALFPAMITQPASHLKVKTLFVNASHGSIILTALIFLSFRHYLWKWAENCCWWSLCYSSVQEQNHFQVSCVFLLKRWSILCYVRMRTGTAL